MPLLRVDQNGLWCEAGGFHIDPWGSVPKALITHGHSDHARIGSSSYLCAAPSERILRLRLGSEFQLQTITYGDRLTVGDVIVSFHPAGHVLGSAQIRVEHRGEVWVVSGDYKLAADPTCAPFEPVRCNTFVTESTFGLPIYRWHAPETVFTSINDWWRANRDHGRCSMIFGYPLGKSQRALTGLDPEIGPIYCHGAIERMNQVYRESGVSLPATTATGEPKRGQNWAGAMVVAPPSAQGSTWMRRFGEVSTGMLSGWMRIRGTRRRQSMDRGFVLSDHADWPGLLQAIGATGADCVLVTHGYRAPLVRWLSEQGKDARALETRFEGEALENEAEAAE
ncbi:MAG: putative mRNA 3-end processing factor [Bryobacterales bacterium]|jgi:putative mRNA 3-end processing factor|nr:putative mRNA 3-end processing factor [Bryobacterales bacterium]